MLVSSVSSVFFCMLQLLHLGVSKVDQVLHMRCVWEAVDGTDDVQGGVGDVGAARDHYCCASSQAHCARGSFAPCAGSVQTLAHRSDVSALASPYLLL
jgi:hypothetical protein